MHELLTKERSVYNLIQATLSMESHWYALPTSYFCHIARLLELHIDDLILMSFCTQFRLIGGNCGVYASTREWERERENECERRKNFLLIHFSFNFKFNFFLSPLSLFLVLPRSLFPIAFPPSFSINFIPTLTHLKNPSCVRDENISCAWLKVPLD